MLYCTLNGKKAYPDTSAKIKVTYENQYINDSGSYTYEITFPMYVLVNKVLFSNADRFEVRKKINDFDDCKLYVDNRLIISGKGTVTGITNEQVKMQIVGGSSRIKYDSNFSQHYIDEIEYDEVKIDTFTKSYLLVAFHMFTFDGMTKMDLSSSPIVGEWGKYSFNPIYDETNECFSNAPFIAKMDGDTEANAYMFNLSVQPWLLYVLQKVLEYEGYSIAQNDFNVDPWKRLVIANAKKVLKIKYALPHWTVYTFLDEVRKLFNCSYVFNESAKTVKIVSANELTSNDTVNYDSEDEFSVEHDDDGLSNLATSNIEYDFPDSANRGWRDFISKNVQDKFEIKEYGTVNELTQAAASMTQKERMTHLFKVGYNWYVFAFKDDAEGAETTEEERVNVGFFNPIIRDKNSDDFVDLKITPVAMAMLPRWPETDNTMQKFMAVADAIKGSIVVPSITNAKEASLDSLTLDENAGGDYYVSIKDAMQGAEISDDKETSDEKMQVMFQSPYVIDQKNKIVIPVNNPDNCKVYRYPNNYTDYRMFPKLCTPATDVVTDSLSLDQLPHASIGNYRSNVDINKKDLITIKFITNEIPDPSKIYIFRGKRYICSKVEMQVSNDGIDLEKTGYFYELLG